MSISQNMLNVSNSYVIDVPTGDINNFVRSISEKTNL